MESLSSSSKRKRSEEKCVDDPTLEKKYSTCQHVNSDGSLCGFGIIDTNIQSLFGFTVCKMCRSEHDDYDLITKTEASTMYLLPSSTFSMLRHSPKVNVQHPSWAPIQLYLRKQVKDAAILRFGSEENLNNELRIRGERRFQKQMIKVGDTLRTVVHDYRTSLCDTPNSRCIEVAKVASVNDSCTNGGAGPKRRGGALGGRKKSALLDMAKCIRG